MMEMDRGSERNDDEGCDRSEGGENREMNGIWIIVVVGVMNATVSGSNII